MRCSVVTCASKLGKAAIALRIEISRSNAVPKCPLARGDPLSMSCLQHSSRRSSELTTTPSTEPDRVACGIRDTALHGSFDRECATGLSLSTDEDLAPSFALKISYTM